MIDRFFHDIRYAARGLRKAPAFTVVVVLMLALGIGANTAIFTVIRAVLLKPLNYADPDTLVELGGGTSMIRFEDMRAAAKSYLDIGAYLQHLEDVTLSGAAEPEVLKQVRVSANCLDILGVKLASGRGSLPQRMRTERPPWP